MSEPTTKERLAILETTVADLVEHLRTRDRWMMRILGGLVTGVVLFALPGCVELLVGLGAGGG